MSKKIFILGDSRTGTTTLHKFMKIAGFRSIHYFFKESGVEQPAHLNYDHNWTNLKHFIYTSGYDAFSDYPIRTFYRDLFEEYPDAVFILTTRKDVETWRRSMISFFSKFNIDLNIEDLTASYIRTNDEIRQLAKHNNSKFCEINIDDSSEENGAHLTRVLELDEPLTLGWENKTDAYDNKLWTTRVTIFNTVSKDVLDYVKRVTFPSKAMLSEYGWVYLVNDSSDFMDFAYGDEEWAQTIVERATTVLAKRRAKLKSIGSDYLKFVIPEKATIYPEYMPKIFKTQKLNESRPATQIAAINFDGYMFLDAVLNDAKSFGQLYFRGDSHVNWLGAYFVYYAIISRVNEVLGNRSLKRHPPLGLANLEPFLVSYGGDLYSQLDDELKSFFQGAWAPINLGDKLEYTVGLKIRNQDRTSQRVEVDSDYIRAVRERETFKFKNKDSELPRAVIFRDSTSDYIVDLIAEHFSSSIFVWHKGLIYEDIIEKEKPDIVLHIMAERFLIQYDKVRPFERLF